MAFVRLDRAALNMPRGGDNVAAGHLHLVAGAFHMHGGGIKSPHFSQQGGELFDHAFQLEIRFETGGAGFLEEDRTPCLRGRLFKRGVQRFGGVRERPEFATKVVFRGVVKVLHGLRRDRSRGLLQARCGGEEGGDDGFCLHDDHARVSTDAANARRSW